MRAAFFAMLLSLAVTTQAQAVPIDVYGHLPSLDEVTLSPDGSKVAYVAEDPEQGRFIVVQPLAGGQPLGMMKSNAIKVRDLEWIDEQRIIVLVSTTARPRDVLGSRYESYGALVFDFAKNSQYNLMALTGGRAMNTVTGYPQIRMVGGKAMVFAEGVSFPDRQGRLSLFSVDPASRQTTLLEAHFANARDYFVDASGQTVAEEDYRDSVNQWLLRIKSPRGWTDVRSETIDVDTPNIEGISEDGHALVVDFHAGDDIQVKLFPLDGGAPVAGPAPENESDTPILDRLTGRIIGYRRFAHDLDYVWSNEKDRAAWRKVLALFSGEQVDLQSVSDDHAKVAVLVTGRVHGYGYYIVDVKSGALTNLGPAYNGLGPNDLNRVSTFVYPAADGRQIDAYLTLPHGREAENLPLIVMPHGGPAARDMPGFDWWSQALASLGYAVLQPQFRGSSGFGRDLLEAGYGQWGRKMQTDLSDGVRALTRAKIIDPKRVCIVGGSYGGYAALAGATIDTGVYRCVVSVAGVADLKGMIVWSGRGGSDLAQRYWTRFMGASSPDDAALDAISPIKHAGAVTVPVLLIHGKDDTVVPYAQSDDMESALRHSGKTVKLITLEGEDHWLSRSETRLSMLKATADFLQANNPP